MEDFSYRCPTEVIFGEDAEEKISRCIRKYKGNNIMLVYGNKSAKNNDLLNRICKELDEEETSYILFGDARSNPSMEHAREGVKVGIEAQIDMVIGIGGGSAVDTAKAIAHGIANPKIDIGDFWAGKAMLRKTIPIGCIMTNFGSGSEMSDSAVLTDESLNRKSGLVTELNRPLFSILNPELTLGMSLFQTACGVVDIMMHTMERYFNNGSNEVTDDIALALIKNVIRNGRKAVKDPLDINSKSELMWAGSLSNCGLTGLGSKGDWACHLIGHELTVEYNVTHGESLSAIWGSWANFVYKENIHKFEKFAQIIWNIKESGETAALKGIQKTVEYFKEIGMPVMTDEINDINKESTFREIAERSTKKDTFAIGNLKKLNENDVYQILLTSAAK